MQKQKIYIIAEIGINHNGDINIAKKLIDIAQVAGCDIVKFQKRNPDICVPEHQKSVVKHHLLQHWIYFRRCNKISVRKFVSNYISIQVD